MNKRVLTVYKFPSFQVLGLGQVPKKNLGQQLQATFCNNVYFRCWQQWPSFSWQSSSRWFPSLTLEEILSGRFGLSPWCKYTSASTPSQSCSDAIIRYLGNIVFFSGTWVIWFLVWEELKSSRCQWWRCLEGSLFDFFWKLWFGGLMVWWYDFKLYVFMHRFSILMTMIGEFYILKVP